MDLTYTPIDVQALLQKARRQMKTGRGKTSKQIKRRLSRKLILDSKSAIIMKTDLVTSIARELSDPSFSPYQLYVENFNNTYNRTHIISFNAEQTEKFIKNHVIKALNNAHLLIKSYETTHEDIGFTDDDDNHYSRHSHFVLTECNILITLHESGHGKYITFLYEDKSQDLVNTLSESIKKEVDAKPKEANNIHIICSSQGRFFTESYPISFEETVPFEDCYNENLLPVDKIIIEKLSRAKSKGIVLLHGVMGSGKTTYLRRLIKEVKKKVIYLPPEMAHDISSPSFITFLMENPDSVLFIEDAENVLKSREAGGSQAVSNLLNVTDGILSDALHLQIACTFNCPKEQIDKALLRPGRLIAEYEFEELSAEKTLSLIGKIYSKEEINKLVHLKGGMNNLHKKMTLAEIFNLREELPISVSKKVSFGFTPAHS